MTTALRGRSLPYRDTLHSHQRICGRCGRMFTINTATRNLHTNCRDCRDVEKATT